MTEGVAIATWVGVGSTDRAAQPGRNKTVRYRNGTAWWSRLGTGIPPLSLGMRRSGRFRAYHSARWRLRGDRRPTSLQREARQRALQQDPVRPDQTGPPRRPT